MKLLLTTVALGLTILCFRQIKKTTLLDIRSREPLAFEPINGGSDPVAEEIKMAEAMVAQSEQKVNALQLNKLNGSI